MSAPASATSPIDVLLAIVRFVLLSAQAGFAVGALSMSVMCFRECGGYGELIYAAGFAVLGAVVTFATFAAHFAKNCKANRPLLARQAKIQWVWLLASLAVAFVFYA